ncbi:MAG: LysE family transporter [Candidatus Nomurabacteria bacterium]|nr:LysE family transporter [Candidatus Nomurabacteria bacterium]
MKIFTRGLITGLIIQLAIGPVFFFSMNLALQKTLLDGIVAVLAVTLVDYFYIMLAIFGIGKLLEKIKIKKTIGVISSLILILFGAFIIKSITVENVNIANIDSFNIFSSFITVFILAISNPMLIVWNTSLLTTKAIEYNYAKKELIIFGLSVGLATPIVFGLSVVLLYLLRVSIPLALIQVLNLIVGCLLIVYGGIRLIKISQTTQF